MTPEEMIKRKIIMYKDQIHRAEYKIREIEDELERLNLQIEAYEARVEDLERELV